MHDIKIIRENPEHFDAQIHRRGLGDKPSIQILKADLAIRAQKTKLQDLQEARKLMAKKIGKLKSQDLQCANEMTEAETIRAQISEIEIEIHALEQELYHIMAALPNILQDDVPEGSEESDALLISSFGNEPKFDFQVKDHVRIGEDLGILDFKQTSKISGARFVTLKGDLAKLERVLADFMIENHKLQYGYTEISAPSLVKTSAAFGTGQLPKFEEDLFKTTDGHWLIPTSEMTLTNLVCDTLLTQDALPLRFTSFSNCFRSEAGSAGKDTYGMIRMHQFSKVELVSITDQKSSKAEHERMLNAAQSILELLDLPYKTISLPEKDVGFGSTKTYDIEVFIPSQKKYREISSCSNCMDFQARRMNARYKALDKKNYFLHTLNGSGVAVGRLIVAILENYQNQDGSVTIPSILQERMKKAKIGT